MVCINESKLVGNEQTLFLPGYSSPIELRRTGSKGGGLWFVIKQGLGNKVKVLQKGDDKIEQLWLQINMGTKKIIAAKCACASSYLDAFDKEFPCRFVWMDGWTDYMQMRTSQTAATTDLIPTCFRRSTRLDKAEAKSSNTNKNKKVSI